MTNAERRRAVRESIATILACTLTAGRPEMTEKRLMNLSKRLEGQISLPISFDTNWNWKAAEEFFYDAACEALDGRL